MSLLEKIRVTQAFLESKGIEKPEFGLILGSGLGELAEEVEDAVVIDYADIPNWGQSTVVGHAGKLVYGTLSGRKVLALQGRFHFYEGNPLEVVTFPVRVMKALGCEGVVVTNAAGSKRLHKRLARKGVSETSSSRGHRYCQIQRIYTCRSGQDTSIYHRYFY